MVNNGRASRVVVRRRERETAESVRVQVNLAIRAQNRQKSRIFHIDALAYITIVSFYGKDGHYSDHVVLVLKPQTVTPNPP